MGENGVTKSRRGGRREGAGRPSSVLTKKKALSLRERHPIFPLDYMMSVLNAPEPEFIEPEVPKGMEEDREFMKEHRRQCREIRQQRIDYAAMKMDAAKNAAAYIHPRLAAVEISEINKPQTKQSIDVTKLTDEELAFLERVIMKSQTTTVIDDDPQDAAMIEYDDSGYRNVF